MFNLNKDPELISKEAILKDYQDIDIYRKYIDFELKIAGKPVFSPLRDEETPSFGFFIGESGEVCFKDFKLGGGDFVKFVQLMFGLNYFEALSQIAVDFGIDGDYICKSMNKISSNTIKSKNITREQLISDSELKTLGKRSRKWSLEDKEFWTSFGIGIKTLRKYNVEPIDYMFINDKSFKTDKYAYCFTEFKDGRETYKIYQPYNKKYKWINNHDNSVWQGWEQLPSTGIDLIITKSLKDVMAIWDVCQIPAIALQSENVVPKRHVFQQLKDRFQDIVLLYDNDYDKEVNWGMKFGSKIAEDYGIMDCYLDKKWECKDFSDLVKKYGPDKAKEILTMKTLIPF